VLLDRRVRWEPIGANTARLVLPFGEEEDSLRVEFDPRTGLMTQMSGMRYRGGEERKTPWRGEASSSILVLDEPTANLDPETEAGVLDAAYDLMRDRATLVITHRLVRMEDMDEILVLDRGRIVERGTHVELVNSHGLYRELYETQCEVLVAS
jgi:ABC-type transport system involved in cytochrome bd biosynthesis fused ATPase/permease subunit